MKGILAMPVLLMLLCGSAFAGPELNIGTFYDYLDGDKSTLLKRVRNAGDATAFVKVSVVELVYDNQGQAREVEMDGREALQRGLVVSPARLIIPANGMQAVRLLYRGERDQERYFRLRFIPVLPEVDDGFAITEDEAERYEDALKVGVNILAGYGSILFVRPQASRYQTEVEHQAGRFLIPNKGNTTIVLDHFNDCAAGNQDCVPATKHHVLPGNVRVFEKKPGRHYRFELIEGEQRREIAFQG
ncbi:MULTISPECIES: pilus assembly protein [Pseudomonas]|uniref:Molecular chaperone n=1 Tax=Pseudomonas donghuensis TaxID=1163398 RepID=A0AAP0SHY5_9PSED|nr:MULTISPECIES: pilus assembly protein [Pseudomonas]MDF9894403.1 P pilus assembly chaperone PapD [Pseudomonas vranovensis]KDN98447.2 molecular chaperone [Pseudomonas donghuensis]MBF4208318.1 molecular chaperone [Pseudomonas donghuensis]MCP6692298.1 molecular chaperone [Pseudomonas donghuensis]MCP6698224.1 molecular chaperone [Pseudomonas donghuensis]